MAMRLVGHGKTTCPSAEMITKLAIFNAASRGGNAFSLDMMVMAFLRQPNFGFKAQNLRPIFTHGTIHIVASMQNFQHPIGKGGNHLWMVVQIACFDKFDIGIGRCNLVGKAVNPVNQNARKQKIGKNNNPPITKPGDMFKTGLNQRERNA